MSFDPTWTDLIIGVLSAIAGWLAKHYSSGNSAK